MHVKAVPQHRRSVTGFSLRRSEFSSRSVNARFLVGKMAGFIQLLRFPIPIVIPPNAVFASSVIPAGYNGVFTAQEPRDPVSSHPKNKTLPILVLSWHFIQLFQCSRYSDWNLTRVYHFPHKFFIHPMSPSLLWWPWWYLMIYVIHSSQLPTVVNYLSTAPWRCMS